MEVPLLRKRQVSAKGEDTGDPEKELNKKASQLKILTTPRHDTHQRPDAQQNAEGRKI